MRGRIRSTAQAALVAAAVSLIVIGPAAAESPGKLVSKGNSSFRKGDYDRAIELYEKASVRAPESPVVAFDLGDAFYRTGEFSKAREYFGDAALKARDLSLEAGAWYNSGNCAFREAERQVDSDMEKALELFQEAVRFYMTALEKDPQLTDAGHNLEVTRLVIKDLLDKIKKQQEMMREQQEMMKEVVDSLLSLIKRQEGAIERSGVLTDEMALQAGGWKERLGGLEKDQKGIAEGTGVVLDKLGELFPGEQPPQVKQASSHLDTSLVNQDDALEDLAKERPDGAAGDQELALGQMKKALENLAQGEQQPKGGQDEQQGDQPQQNEQAQQEPEDRSQQQAGQKPRDENARAILDEEKENRKKRQQQARRGYRPVERDW